MGARGGHEAHVQAEQICDEVDHGRIDWGNIGALPVETQRRIEASTRANAKAYQTADGFVFPHSVLLGLAMKP